MSGANHPTKDSVASAARLARAREHISDYMDRILEEFTGGQKITVLVRTPGNDNADLLLTNDDIGEVASMVERAKTRPES